MRKLLKYLKPYWLYVILAPLLMIVEVGSELLMPKIMSYIVDIGVANHDFSYIISRGILMIIIAFFGIVGGAGCTICSSKAAMGFGTDIRKDMLDRIQNFSFVNLDKFKTSSLITRLTNDITQVQQIVMMSLRMLVRAPATFIGGLIMAITINARLSLILVVAIIVLFTSVFLIIRKVGPLFNIVQQKIDNVNTVMRENLAGVRVIKSFVREKKEKEKFDVRNTELRDTTISAFRIVTLIFPVLIIIMNVVTVIILWRGGHMVFENIMPTGDLMAYITYLTQILMSLMMVSMVFVMISRGGASAERIGEIFATEIDITEPENAITSGIDKGKIEFKNVSFRYPESTGDPVLENINLTINSGETVGILGETGAGKSTLVNLIPRLYDTTEGDIFIDGKNVKNISLDYLRSSIGTVLQKTILFSGTIKNNIKWGDSNASDEEIIECAKDAQAYDFIVNTDNGFDTELGQMGVNVSGGQKQRISIARTLLKKSKILIFDDSTSALDTGTEAKIQSVLKNKYKDVTKIIIAQKISSVMNSDKIILIHGGKIIGEGNHDYLMANSEEYREIYESQIREEDELNGR